jgi:hypothetical protein
MYKQLKISQHSHSGRLRPHEHTSYIPLVALIILVGVMLLGMSVQTYVDASPGPQAGSIGLTGTVPTPPPTQSATISSPNNLQHFAVSPITVSGTCPTGTFVEIYKNNIFAGSTPCDNSGKYTVQIDLLYGQNILTAQVYDVLNQAGPVSSPVTIFYDAAPQLAAGLSILNFGASQLLLNTDAVYRGTFPGQMLNVPISILGGAAPFALNVQWGDSSNKVIPRGDNSVFNASHTYEKAGTYKITFQASDAQQQVAFLSVAAIINGQPAVIAGANSGSSKKTLNKLLVLWLGERREKKIMTKMYAAKLNPTLGASPHLTV